MPRISSTRQPDRLLPMGFRIWPSSGATMDESHTHADIEVNYLFSGTVEYFLGGRFERVKTGCLTLFWGGMPHRSLCKSPDAQGIWLTFPLGWLLRYSFTQRLRNELLAGKMVAEGNPGEFPGNVDGDRLRQWLKDYQTGDARKMDIIFSELGDRLNRLSLSSDTQSERSRGSLPNNPTKRLEKLTTVIGDCFQHELNVAELAKVAGLHPKYLHLFFKKHCGISLWEYVLRLRLAHVQRLLATTDMTVIDAALESGFGSQAAFYHAFKTHFPGRKPADIRRGKVHSGDIGQP